MFELHTLHLEHATQFEHNVTLFLPPTAVLRVNYHPRVEAHLLPRRRALPAEQDSDHHGKQRERRADAASTAARRHGLTTARIR